MSPRTVTCALLLACASWFGAPHVEAQSRAAVRHYERGREHYQAGRYPEAAQELEIAHGLDPNSPTLVYNLARVYELMSDFERATFYYSRLMELTPRNNEQHVTARAALERVRGAQALIDAQRAADDAARLEREQAEAAARETEAQARERRAREEATIEAETRLRVRGRADGLFYGSALFGLGALSGGAVLGLYALRRDNRADDWVLSPTHSAEERSAAQARARRMAIGADLLLGAGLAAGVSALLLYYLRERHPRDEATRALRLDLAPHRQGAMLCLGGSL